MDKLHNTQKAGLASLNHERSIVLVGMMLAGKSAVGRKLAARLDLSFCDSDVEIESASGMTISQFFETRGEPEFRQGERRVIERLLDGRYCVLSVGGGAFMDQKTRALIKAKGLSVWIKADLELLVKRATRKNDRPLLQGGDLREKLTGLLVAREPLYATADLMIESDDGLVDDTVNRVIKALEQYAPTRGSD